MGGRAAKTRFQSLLPPAERPVDSRRGCQAADAAGTVQIHLRANVRYAAALSRCHPAALRRPWAESPPGAHQPAWPGGGLAPRRLRQAGRGYQERRKLYVHQQSTGQVRKGHSRKSLLLLPHRERRQGSRHDGGRQLGRWCPRAYRLAGKAIFPQSGRNADYHDDAGRGSELPHPAGRLRSGTGRPLEPILAAHNMPALG